MSKEQITDYKVGQRFKDSELHCIMTIISFASNKDAVNLKTTHKQLRYVTYNYATINKALEEGVLTPIE